MFPSPFFSVGLFYVLVYRAVLITLLDYADCPLRATSPLYPPKKNWYKVLKKQTNKKANNLYWQDTQRVW